MVITFKDGGVYLLMQFELLFSFLIASLLLTIMPGPDNIFVLTESISKGKKNGIAISIGLVLGVLVHTMAAATGLSLLIQKSATVFSVIKYLGAAYLFYLAYQATREEAIKTDLSAGVQASSFAWGKLIRKGFFMNVLNPKVSLFFIAFLPQFISPSGFSPTLQMIVLGLVFMVQALVIFSLISIFSGSLSSYMNSQRFWKTTKWAKVSVLSILGLMVALGGKE